MLACVFWLQKLMPPLLRMRRVILTRYQCIMAVVLKPRMCQWLDLLVWRLLVLAGTLISPFVASSLSSSLLNHVCDDFFVVLPSILTKAYAVWVSSTNDWLDHCSVELGRDQLVVPHCRAE